MTKHTPAPLAVALNKNGIVTISGNRRSTGWDHICELDASGNDEEQIANAKLFAAAPDMLVELKRAEAWLSEWKIVFTTSEYNVSGYQNFMHCIRACIAKAEGK